MAFEVASVKPAARFVVPNFPLSAEDGYVRGGRLTAAFNLSVYIELAYKLWLTPKQRQEVLDRLPKWVGTDLYEVRAEGAGNATKDQMRLMMQALLADRFQLKVHFESREVPVLALTLDKPGELGPRLRPHSEGPPCPEYQNPTLVPPTKDDVFPAACGVTGMRPASPGQLLVGSRDTTIHSRGIDISRASRNASPAALARRAATPGPEISLATWPDATSANRIPTFGPKSDMPNLHVPQSPFHPRRSQIRGLWGQQSVPGSIPGLYYSRCTQPKSDL